MRWVEDVMHNGERLYVTGNTCSVLLKLMFRRKNALLLRIILNRYIYFI